MYRKHKIRRKRIQLTKPVKPEKLLEYEAWRQGLKERISELKGDGYKIIYLDESMFTTKTFRSAEYMVRKQHLQIPMPSVSQRATALIMAISEEDGAEHHGIYKDSVNQQKFAEYIDELYIANKHTNIAVFMDNLSVHRTKSIQKQLDELDIPSIFSVPYSPDLNPVEHCFSKIKNHYKRKKLNMLMAGEDFDVDSLIEGAVAQLKKSDIVNNVRLSLKLINE